MKYKRECILNKIKPIPAKQWDSLSDALVSLNNNTRYLILRNFEDLSNENYYMDGHGDIDFLVEDIWEARRALHVHNTINWNSPNHFSITINDKIVKVGLRYLGDDYYDEKWESYMLNNRQINESGFYVMDDESYFYSLLYHALLQKDKLSSDYRARLYKMGMALNVQLDSEMSYNHVLFNYLHRHDYKVPYPKDPSVVVNYHLVPNDLLKRKTTWRFKKVLWILCRGVFKVEKKIFRGNI